MRLVLLLVGVMLSARSAADGIWWTGKLQLSDLAQLPQRLNAPFEDKIPVSKGSRSAVAGNCADYLLYVPQGFEPASDMEGRVLRSWGVDCDALKALEHVRAAKRSFLKGFVLNASALRSLPPEMSTSLSNDAAESAKRADAEGLSWAAFRRGAKAEQQGDKLVIADGSTRTTLEIYARGDFNGDGLEDLLVRDDSSVVRGTYTDSRLFVLTRRSPAGRLSIVVLGG